MCSPFLLLITNVMGATPSFWVLCIQWYLAQRTRRITDAAHNGLSVRPLRDSPNGPRFTQRTASQFVPAPRERSGNAFHITDFSHNGLFA